MGIPWRRSQGRWPLIRPSASFLHALRNLRRRAKFSPAGGRLGPKVGRGKGRAREFIVQSRSISEILSARFPMPLTSTDDAPRFAVGHAARLLESVMPLDTKHCVSPEVQEVTLQSSLREQYKTLLNIRLEN